MNIILGEQQKQALDLITTFLHSKKRVFSLVGYAGTGKTTIIRQMIDYLEDKSISYVLCAPTHKAKSAIRYNTERDAITIHQLLSLSPNVEIQDLDLRDLKFISNGYKVLSIPFDGVVICDESSMINDVLFNLMLEKCGHYNSKIIFVGDKAQLKPVNESNHSLVFNVKDTFELTQIYRQLGESGLSSVLPILREKSINRFSQALGKDGSLYCVNDAKALFTESIPRFIKAIAEKDIFEAKVLAYTNNRVEALNNKMRSILFPNSDEYYNGELLTAYENFTFGFSSYWNSMDYIIDDTPKETSIRIPHFIEMPGHLLSLYDAGNKSSGDIIILSKDLSPSYRSALGALIEESRLDAIEKKNRKDRGSGLAWKRYYEIINSFASPFHLYYDGRVVKKKTFDYGYACTVHKS